MNSEFENFYKKYYSEEPIPTFEKSTSLDILSTTSGDPLKVSSQYADVAPDAESYSSYFDPRFPKWISIFLLIVGIFGNSLCLFIFSRKNMRKHSTFVYLFCLAVIDLCVLTFGLGDIILIAYLSLNVRNYSLIICRIISFLIYLFTHLSSFILASVSIDRAIATNFITFSKTYCRPVMAYKVIAINILIAVFINFHNLFFIGHTVQNSTPVNDENGTSMDYVSAQNRTTDSVQVFCESKKGTAYDKFLDPYFKWIDLLAYAIIPFIIMLICTFLIVRVLFRSNRRLNKNRAPHNDTITKKEQLSPPQLASSLSASKTLLNNNSQPTSKPVSSAANRSNKAKHLTYTLIILNCLFFCLVGPLLIVLVTMNDQSLNNNKILINIVYLLAYSNHSFNFVLYGVSSPPFRSELFKILRITTNTGGAMMTPHHTTEPRVASKR